MDPEAVWSEWLVLRSTIAVRSADLSLQPEELTAYNSIMYMLQEYKDATDTTNIYMILARLSVVVMTTADCERGFSVLKQIKTPTRNRLKQANLNNAMIVAIEGKPLLSFPFDKCITQWKAGKKRRIN